MRTFCVEVEYGGVYGQMVRKTVKADTFDSAVKEASSGLEKPTRAMSVLCPPFGGDLSEADVLDFHGKNDRTRRPKQKYVDGTQCFLPFGKHKGESFEDVPPAYLRWLSLQQFVEWKHSRLYSQLISYLSDPAVARILQAEDEADHLPLEADQDDKPVPACFQRQYWPKDLFKDQMPLFADSPNSEDAETTCEA